MVGNRATRRILSRQDDPDSRHVAPSEKPAPAQRVISTAVVQRKPAAGATLTSPRFAGDPVLEACFQDKARLGVGATGDAVTKVQQALIDLGFDLGPTGADGSYGSHTASAVRQFKKDQRLGFEQIGDVGPGTMARLNELLPNQAGFVATPGEAEEGEEIACPVDDDIVTAGQQRQASSSALVGTTTTAGSAGAGAPGLTTVGRGGPVGIDEAIDRFKQKVNVSNAQPGLNISDLGQFHWGTQIAAEIGADMTVIGTEPGGREFEQRGKRLLLQIARNPKDKTIGAGILELDGIAAKAPTALRQRMLDLMADKPVQPGAVIEALWAGLEKSPDDKMPSVQTLKSVRLFRRVRVFELTECGSHASRVAGRLHRKGGITALDRKVPPLNEVMGTFNIVTDFRPIGRPAGLDDASIEQAIDKSGSSDFMMGQVMQQTGVSSVVGRMQKAIDAGQLLHVRVVSGVGFGGKLGAPNKKATRVKSQLPKKDSKGNPKAITGFEEHSLLVIGFDQDKFVFNDPDANVSSDPKAGFGLLHFDNANSRLGTGETAGDMPVNEDGKTRTGQKRYQVISVKTI